jgi:hypothetical protein
MQSGTPTSKRKLQVRVCKMLRFRRTGLHTKTAVTRNEPDHQAILKDNNAAL